LEQYLPVIPFKDIALALSGGGFRAASYSLGCLSYLERTQYQGEPLLKRVKFISSASGGSITNLFYSLRAAQNRDFKDVYKELYDFLYNSSAITEAFTSLQDDEQWKERTDKGRNLINSFAIAYDQKLFSGAQLKDLANPRIHEVCINSTEFSYGVSFRFQTGSGKMGNSRIMIAEKVAVQFKLGDVLAASSCFPMGFEPILMPADFAHKNLTAEEIKNATTKNLEFGLMDGGITDNQGIHSFLLAEERKFKADQRGYDLFMFCDVSSPYMNAYALPKEKRSLLKSRSLQFYLNLFKITPFIFLGFVAMLKWWHHPWWLIVLTTITGLAALAYVASAAFFHRERIKANQEKSTWMLTLFKYINGILFTRTSALLQMISARIKSAGILVGDVYLKQIRRLTINSLYENGKSGEKWRTHAIANLIYEFSSRNTGRSSECKDLKDADGNKIDMTPSPAITQCADKAWEMDTTLWFDEYHVRDGRREALIAAGQFTTCFNLIEYICKLEKNGLLTDDLKQLRQKLLTDWKKFNQEPQWMVRITNNE
jgi:predicted acylesterase/phospholipase RssA